VTEVTRIQTRPVDGQTTPDPRSTMTDDERFAALDAQVDRIVEKLEQILKDPAAKERLRLLVDGEVAR
jgi:hypothetical protein